MSFSHAYSSVSGLPTHPLLSGLRLNLLDLPYTSDSGFSDNYATWIENSRQVESSQWLGADCSPNTQRCYDEESNAHIQFSDVGEDEGSECAIGDTEETCCGDERSSSQKTRCHPKTGDSQSSSEGLKQVSELSRHHLLASTRRKQLGSETLRTSLTDAQDSVARSPSKLKSSSEGLSDKDKKLQGRDKQQRAVLDDLPGTIWNRICPHLPLDSILRLRLCSRAINRSICNHIDLARPLEKDGLEPSDPPISHDPASASANAAATDHPIRNMAAPSIPYTPLGYGRHGAAMFPPTPPFSYFEPKRLMYTIDKVAGQSTAPTPPLSLHRGHSMELQIPLSEETLSESTVLLSPDEEIYTDMWIAAVAPQNDGDECPSEACATEPAQPECRYDMGPVMQVPLIRAKL